MILDANPVVSEKEPYKGISKQHKNDRLIEGHKEKWWWEWTAKTENQTFSSLFYLGQTKFFIH